MPQQVALFICIFFVLWLFARDIKLRPMTSNALWIVLLWIMIIGSRPVSSWFVTGVSLERVPADYLDGSPLDRNIFLLLIICGSIVLLRRKLNWDGVFKTNPWFFAFFIYCGISILWSDFPFVAFKRWTKELGNVVMILIMLTETDPIMATRAVFLRYTYFAIPLSFIFIKYFPELGRSYNIWTWTPSYCGIATEKNTLGIIIFICGLFLVWDLIETQNTNSKYTIKVDILSRIVLLSMVVWLMLITGSSTALVCLILGVGIQYFIKFPFVKRQVRFLGTYCLLLLLLVFLLYAIPGALDSLVEMFGRNMTFTGRTDIWMDVLKEPINPLLGTGYQSFWLGAGAQHMWNKYYFHPVQAHNGYLETYLNGGLLGVSLLVAAISYTGSKLKKNILLGNNFGVLLFSFFVAALFYNWTEATFCGLNLIWIIFMIAALYHYTPPTKANVNMAQDLTGDTIHAASERLNKTYQ